MATCNFCKREFASTPAVYAHLKSCPAYQEHRRQKRAAHVGRPSFKQNRQDGGSISSTVSSSSLVDGDGERTTPDSDVVRQLDNRIAEETRRLKLRGLEDAHAELDRRAETRKRQLQQEADKQAEARRTAEREQEAARQREQQTRQAQETSANTDQQKRQRRREAIQAVKRKVVEQWLGGMFLGSSLKADMLREIEATLAPLPVEELPKDELARIAVGVRDRLHGEAMRAEQRAQQKAQELADRKRHLLQHGVDYARRALREVDDLDEFDRTRIELRVRGELETIEGDESNLDIEDLVDEILEREGIEYDEDEE